MGSYNLVLVVFLLAFCSLPGSAAINKSVNQDDINHVENHQARSGEFNADLSSLLEETSGPLRHSANIEETTDSGQYKLLKKLILEVLKENRLISNRHIKHLERTVKTQDSLLEKLKQEMEEKTEMIAEMGQRIVALEKGKSEEICDATNNDVKQREKNTHTEKQSNRSDIQSNRKDSSPRYGENTEKKQASSKFGNNNSESESNSKLVLRQITTQKVAFSVYLTSTLPTTDSLPENAPFKFDGVLLNEGDMYNKYTGIFTAPYSGIYYFSYHFTVAQTGLIVPTLKRNGQNQVSVYLNPHDYSLAGSSSAVLNLSKGDSVWVEVKSYSGVEIKSNTEHHSTVFSGFLLYQR